MRRRGDHGRAPLFPRASDVKRRPRRSSLPSVRVDARLERPRCFLMGVAGTEHRPRSPTAPMTRDNPPLGPEGREGGSPSANGEAEQRNSGRNAVDARGCRTNQRNTTINPPGNKQQHTYLGGGGGSRGDRRGRRRETRGTGGAAAATARRRGAPHAPPPPFPRRRRWRSSGFSLSPKEERRMNPDPEGDKEGG